MVKYKTSWRGIAKIEIERETKKQVVLMNGNRASKLSSYECYFDTWEGAKKYLLDKAQMKVQGIRRQLETANSELGNIKGMKEPV